ncbi:MAG: hypothetical protein KJ851_04000, partial [Nanoarchaeota archaeon]|nr:hypothetical protein [Nanoarchaeota archaeon]
MPTQTLLLKQESETDEKYGCAPQNRKIKEYVINGLVNLDKPRGPTSHEVAAWVRNIFGSVNTQKASSEAQRNEMIFGSVNTQKAS